MSGSQDKSAYFFSYSYMHVYNSMTKTVGGGDVSRALLTRRPPVVVFASPTVLPAMRGFNTKAE